MAIGCPPRSARVVWNPVPKNGYEKGTTKEIAYVYRCTTVTYEIHHDSCRDSHHLYSAEAVGDELGTITLRRPRVRGVEERFESRVLPLFARRTKELGALLPELYLHGLAEGDFELAMRGLLGEGAPLSKSSIRRLRAGWTAEFEEWSQRRLEGREVVYVWADGIYVKAGLERDKAALLVVLGAMRDGTKEVLALRSGYHDSTDSR